MPKRRLFDGPIGEFLRKHKILRRLALIGGIVVAIYFLGAQNGWWGADKNEPVSYSAAPSGDLLVSVKPVRDLLRSKDLTLTNSDTQRLAAVFKAVANAIENDDERLVTSTGAVARAHSRAGRLFFGDTLKGKYPGLGSTVDRAIASHVGSGDVPLSDTKRKQVVEVFRALAWAAGQH